MKNLFIEYTKCSTCKKAKKWLEENNIEFEDRNIVEETPTVEELTVFQDVVERGKAAATVLRNMLLSCTTSEFQCVFAYESFFACLAASDSPLAQHASTIIAALVTVSESLVSG